MTGPLWRRCALPGVLAATLMFAGCGDSNPYGPPYYELGRLLAGVYSPTTEGGSQGMRLVLGSRHTVTGRYEDTSGQTVRFEGTWERAGDRLVVYLEGPGVPSSIELGYGRETTLTLIPSAPGPRDEDAPEDSQRFLEQDVMRLTGTAVVAGVSVNLDLARVITDIITIGGGGTN